MVKIIVLPAFYRLIFCITLLFLFSKKPCAQLCTGSLGDPVVNITFGSGTNPGNPLDAATTNYLFVGNDCPQDGMYTIRNQTLSCHGSTWHSIYQDHTGQTNGYFMLVNASFSPSDFYLQTINGLCGNTTYEFAAWIMNMCLTEDRIKPNITFKIEKTDGTVLQTFNSGDIGITTLPEWKQYGFFFKTPANISSVVIRMTNNAPGGIGNDLALDDITFRPCGAKLNAGISGINGNTIDFCEGNATNITLTSSVSAGYNQPVFLWQVSTDNGATWKDIQGATSLNYTRTPTSKGKYVYRITVAEAGNGGISACRIASNPVYVNINPNPVVQLSGDETVCEGSSLTLKASVSYNSLTPWDTTWTFPNPNNTIISNTLVIDTISAFTLGITKVIKASMPDAGTYTLSVQNKFGCQASGSVVVAVHPKPVARFTISSPECEKKDISFSDVSSGQAAIKQWNWDFGDGTSSSSQNPIHRYATSNSYSVSLTVKDDNGCSSDPETSTIQVHPLPVINFGLPKICLSDPYAAFSDSSTISDHNEAGFSYAWNFGDPGFGASNNSAIKNPQHKYTATGNYNVQLSVRSQDGCINDTTRIFTVNGVVPKALFTINNTGVLCSSDLLSLTNTSTVDFGTIVKVEIYWNNDQDQSIKTVDTSPYEGKTYNYDYSGLMDQSSKNFQIRYVAYSGINCVNETQKSISIHRNPVVQFDAIPPVCEETSPFIITQANETSGAVGTGNFTGAGVNNSGLFNPAAAKQGIHSLNYTFTSDAGCKSSTNQNIEVYPQPSVDAGADRIVIKGTYITLHANANGKNLSYLWTPSSNIDNATILTPKVSPTSEMIYTLTATSSDGCSNHDDVLIQVINGLYVPTAFTPNGDGHNDAWRLPSLESYPNAQVMIFDRWGNVVYHSSGAIVSWDGTFNGKPQPSGTYIYLIDLKTTTSKLKGTIILIR